MALGWRTISRKGLTLAIPKGTDHENESQYTPFLRIEPGQIELGPTLIGLEVRMKLPTIRPKDLISQLHRINSPDGWTAKKTHSIGSLAAWSDVWIIPEYINPDDLPLDICFWHNGGGDAIVSTVIAKPFAPTAFAADRLRVKS